MTMTRSGAAGASSGVLPSHSRTATERVLLPRDRASANRLTLEGAQRVLGILSLIAFPAARAALSLELLAAPSYVALALASAIGLGASLIPTRRGPPHRVCGRERISVAGHSSS